MAYDYCVVNGWLIYKQGKGWVMDDEVQTKLYFGTQKEAIEYALNLE